MLLGFHSVGRHGQLFLRLKTYKIHFIVDEEHFKRELALKEVGFQPSPNRTCRFPASGSPLEVERKVRVFPLPNKIIDDTFGFYSLGKGSKPAIQSFPSLREVRKLPGYHDEPLKGQRQGQRSIRLSKGYRAIYQEENDGTVNLVIIEEVNKHEY